MYLKTKASRSLLAAAVLFSLGQATLSAQEPELDQEQQRVSRTILIKFKDGVPEGRINGLIKSAQANLVKTIPQINVLVVELPEKANRKAYINAFKSLGEVEFAEEEQYLAPQALDPNDYYYLTGIQWAPGKISARDAWSITTGSSSVKIAVVDSGVDGNHPDLIAKMVPGWNTYDNNSNATDVRAHGTNVAGVAAASTNNLAGIAAICWGCMIMPVRSSDPTGWATSSQVADGVIWAADHGARVVVAGFKVTGNSTVSSAAQYLWGKSGLLITPAGDYGFANTPPDDPYILEVGSTDENDVRYSWSDSGAFLDLVAPGCSYTTGAASSYISICGTSLSAPQVAGVAGLLLSQNPSLTPAQLRDKILQSADDLGSPGRDAYYGAGRLNAFRALSASAPGDTTPPSAPASLTASAVSSTQVNLLWTASTDNVGVTGYRIYRGASQIGTSTATSYSDTTVSAGQSYSYTVRAVDAAGNLSNTSNTATVTTPQGADTTPPSAPTNMTANAPDSTRVNLAWNASTDNVGVAGYRVFRNGAQIITTTLTSYTDTSVSGGLSYSYYVTAYDAAGNTSTASNTASTSVPTALDTTPPSTPTNLAGNAPDSTRVYLSWNASTDNVGVYAYQVFRGGSYIGASFTNTYTDSTVSAGTTYTYTVRAYDAANNFSAYSNNATVIVPQAPDTTAPSTPANLTGSSPSSTGVNLSWSASTDNVGVAGYRVYRGGLQIGTTTLTTYTDNGVSAGQTYSYTVRAYDVANNLSNASNTATVTTQTVSGGDTIAPTVNFVTPSNGATVSGTVNVQVSASDNVGVTKTELYINGSLVSSSNNGSLTYRWNARKSLGVRSLNARSYDAKGNMGQVTISVTVVK